MSKLKRSLPPDDDCHTLLDDKEEEEQVSVEPQATVMAPPMGSDALVSEEGSELRGSSQHNCTRQCVAANLRLPNSVV